MLVLPATPLTTKNVSNLYGYTLYMAIYIMDKVPIGPLYDYHKYKV